MIDQLGRDITYLRISLTDKCNLRCRYCMPAEGVCKRTHQEMMSEDEVVAAVEVAAALGIHKVRLTGGEPLVKKNIVSICRPEAHRAGKCAEKRQKTQEKRPSGARRHHRPGPR